MNNKKRNFLLVSVIIIATLLLGIAAGIDAGEATRNVLAVFAMIIVAVGAPLSLWRKRPPAIAHGPAPSREPTPASTDNGRLVLDMFDGADPNGWLGLQSGQSRNPDSRLTEDARWFNGRAAYLGKGDLSAEDITRITGELSDDETFIILCEPIIGGKRNDSRTPGIEFILTNSNYVIMLRGAYYVSDSISSPGIINQHGVVFERMSTRNLRTVLNSLA